MSHGSWNLLEASFSSRMIGRTGRITSTYYSTSAILKECMVLPWLQLKMMLSSIYCGHMWSKLLMVVKRLSAPVMDLLDRVWFMSLRKPMQIALIKRVPAYFTLLPLLRTYSYMGQTSPTHLLRPHPQNRNFSFSQIVLSMSGGSTINNCHQFLPVTSFQFFLPCRVIQNPHVSGRNMPTNSPENWTHSDSSQTMPLFGHY